MKNFSTLYKKSSDGVIQIWQISVSDNLITTTYGDLGGKMQTATEIIKEGKNLGKKNATTASEQAIKEAESAWNDKITRKGYHTSLDEAKAGNNLQAGGVSPMLAKKYKDEYHKVVFPCAVQPKLDGERCIAVVDASKAVTLWTRTCKPITGVPHINQAVSEAYGALAASQGKTIILDGELYAHDYKDRFEDLLGYIRSKTPKAGFEAVEYWVYDVVAETSFENRMNRIRLAGKSHPKIIMVDTEIVTSHEEIHQFFQLCRTRGFEGAMVRNLNSTYKVGGRSSDLLKVKEFDDAEFQIVGIEEGSGKLAGHVGSFVCQTADGKIFNAKMKGELSNLRTYFLDHSTWNGKVLTVQYQGLTADGIPRFPVGLRFRN